MGLLAYVAVRAALIPVTVLILYTVVFIVLRVLPGDPVLAALGTKHVPPEVLEEIRR
jgi:peptide/nickel transport system permease protein